MSEPKSLIEKVEADLAAQEKKDVEKSKSKEKVKYILIGVALGLYFIGLLVLTGLRYIPKFQYERALQMIEDGNCKEAVITLGKLDGYASSEYYLETVYAQYPQYRLVNAEVGQLVCYGMYNQEKNVAPIEWLVLAKESDRVLLLSRHILDAQPYSGTVELPAWLESTFRTTAFNEKESAAVSEVFLLNRAQIEQYLSGKGYESSKPTTFARSRGSWTDYTGSHNWWSGEQSFGGRHFIVSGGGYIGRQVNSDDEMDGVRPAVWVSLKQQKGE